MDGFDLESSNGVFEDHRWLRLLLCGAFFGALSRRSRTSVWNRFRSHS